MANFRMILLIKCKNGLDKNWNEAILAKLGNKQDWTIAHGVYRDTPRERNGINM